MTIQEQFKRLNDAKEKIIKNLNLVKSEEVYNEHTKTYMTEYHLKDEGYDFVITENEHTNWGINCKYIRFTFKNKRDLPEIFIALDKFVDSDEYKSITIIVRDIYKERHTYLSAIRALNKLSRLTDR